MNIYICLFIHIVDRLNKASEAFAVYPIAVYNRPYSYNFHQDFFILRYGYSL